MNTKTRKEITTTVEVELTDPQAMALAQFVKRVGWHEIEVNAVDDDECCIICEAIDEVRQALAQEGYAPR